MVHLHDCFHRRNEYDDTASSIDWSTVIDEPNRRSQEADAAWADLMKVIVFMNYRVAYICQNNAIPIAVSICMSQQLFNIIAGGYFNCFPLTPPPFLSNLTISLTRKARKLQLHLSTNTIFYSSLLRAEVYL